MDKCKTMWLISIFIFLMLIVNYKVRENFTEDTEVILTDFLNTQKMQTDEVNKIFTVDNNKMKTDKALHFNDKATIVRGTDDTGSNDLGLYSQKPNHWMRFVTDGGPIKFFTDGVAGKRLGQSPAFELHNPMRGTQFNREVDFNKATHHKQSIYVHGDKELVIAKSRLNKGQLCIDGVCIDANNLRVLKGERDMWIKSMRDNKYMTGNGLGGKDDHSRSRIVKW